MERIKMDWAWFSSDGNAFALLGKCQEMFRRAGKRELWDEFYKKATSGNYDNLLATVTEYFELVDDDEYNRRFENSINGIDDED